MPEYKVKFEVFEGPLDLLLYLIKKEEVDIYEVNLTRLATQFIEYIETMRLLDLEVAGEFLVMAATLMYIKSRELLPVDQQAETGEEEEGDDPRWELIRQLVEYKKFKDAAAQLGTLEERRGVGPAARGGAYPACLRPARSAAGRSAARRPAARCRAGTGRPIRRCGRWPCAPRPIRRSFPASSSARGGASMFPAARARAAAARPAQPGGRLPHLNQERLHPGRWHPG